MKKLVLSAICMCLAATAAQAQQPEDDERVRNETPDLRISAGEVRPTPEMWFYQQELERYNDPKLAVRRRAEFVSAQRAKRIATREWFGVSNSRPYASPSGYGGSFSAGWSSNNYYRPYDWTGVGRTNYYYGLYPAPRSASVDH